jgi:hypothetical protein
MSWCWWRILKSARFTCGRCLKIWFLSGLAASKMNSPPVSALTSFVAGYLGLSHEGMNPHSPPWEHPFFSYWLPGSTREIWGGKTA